MKNISIFVDESGDFGSYAHHSPYYIVTMVIHDQDKDITPHVEKLNQELSDINLPNHTIHTEPLIRREEKEYRKSYLNCNIGQIAIFF